MDQDLEASVQRIEQECRDRAFGRALERWQARYPMLRGDYTHDAIMGMLLGAFAAGWNARENCEFPLRPNG